ncbi:MAG: SixA phosphatase family protein [Panacagrimonas sp.]
MLRLTLVRHAKSSWGDPGLDDFARPLNERGRRDAPAMALRVRKLKRLPDRLVSSPALRAITTARIFADSLNVRAKDIELGPQIYDASCKALLEVVRSLDPEVRHVMLFGHNPGFSELGRLLATCPFDEMPTCAVVCLELQVSSWRETGPGCGRVAEYLYPKDGAE